MIQAQKSIHVITSPSQITTSNTPYPAASKCTDPAEKFESAHDYGSPAYVKILPSSIIKPAEFGQLPALLQAVERPAKLEAFEILDSNLGTIACRNVESLRARRSKLEAQGTTLIAVRHGQSVANTQGQTMSGRGDTPLTEDGKKQAESAAVKMLDQLGGSAFLEEVAKDPTKMPIVYASPLSRAFDTAKVLAEKIPGLEIQVEPDIVEIDFGLCEGRQPDEVTQKYPNFGKGLDFTHRFPDGESGFDVLARVDRFLDKVAERHPGQKVIYFAHTMTVGMGSMLLGGVTHNDKGQVFIDRHSIPNASPFILAQPPVEPTKSDNQEFLIAGS